MNEMPRPAPAEPADTPPGETTVVRVRYFAGARAAAGVPEETVRLARPEQRPPSVTDVVDAVLSLHGERLAKVVAASSFLVDGVAVRDRTGEVPDGAEFDVLPPFAGG